MAAAVALRKKNDTILRLRRGLVSIVGLLVFWEIGRRLGFPFLSAVPAPTEVVGSLDQIVGNGKFLTDWIASFSRVLSGFALAQLIGIPVGLLMAMSRTLRYLWFPPARNLAPDPAPRLGTDIDHLLAYHRVKYHFCHFSRRLLHGGPQRPWRRTSNR